jgi:HEAT repeat protein
MRRAVIPALLVLLAVPAVADVVRLRSGARIQGRVLDETPSSVTIDSAGGRIVVSRSTIASIVREAVPPPAAVPQAPTAPPPADSPAPPVKPADPAPGEKPVEKGKPEEDPKPAEPPRPPEALKPADVAELKAKIQKLMDTVGKPGGPTREAMSTELIGLGPDAVPLLLEKFPTLETIDQFLPAVTAITAAPTPEARPALQKLARHEDPERRHVAAFGLGQIGTAEDLPVLGRMLMDEVGFVRYSSREAFVNIQARLPGPEATREAMRLLDDSRGEVRNEIVTLLARLNQPSAVEAVENEAARAEGEARASVWKAFATMSDPRVVSFFERRLRSDSGPERRLALEAVACHRRATAVIPLLLDRIGDEDPELNAAALRHLARLAGKDFGTDAGAWRGWWEGERKAVEEREQMLRKGERG